MGNEGSAKLKASLRGALIGRDDADYDEARKLYNGMIDKTPADDRALRRRCRRHRGGRGHYGHRPSW